MILKTLKRNFSDALSEFYPESEINSFFGILAEQFLNMTRAEVALNMYAVISSKKNDKFEAALSRLKTSEPIQYILGETEFYNFNLKVNSSVLIPRPETEELVDWIIKDVKKLNQDLNILDVGTGSGCIAIALANNLPLAKVYGIDVSEEAIELANENAQLNDVFVDFDKKNILNLEPQKFDIQFNIIVSNPPYVRALEKEDMLDNVLNFEPHLALFVDNEDPLLFYRHIAKIAINNLAHDGFLYFEINEYLSKDVMQLLKDYDFKSIELKRDLSGKDRMIKAIKK